MAKFIEVVNYQYDLHGTRQEAKAFIRFSYIKNFKVVCDCNPDSWVILFEIGLTHEEYILTYKTQEEAEHELLKLIARGDE
jgi:hypothetical protein